MRPLPPEQLARYRGRLNEAGGVAGQQPHCLKWLRYYWDFCIKNSREPLDQVHLEPFIEKLKQKGQSPGLRVQAREVVRLFYGIMVNTADPHEKQKLAGGRATASTKATSHRKDWQEAMAALSDSIKVRHYSPKTRSSYVNWVERFATFHHDKAPSAMTSETARAFLSPLDPRQKRG